VLAPICDAIIVVDVLSFATAVSVAVSRGAAVYPYRWRDGSQAEFAAARGALLAGPRGRSEYSLSPASLKSLMAGQGLVLPSPNGSTISLSTGQTPTFAGCLRNARAVAQEASRYGPAIGVLPCGERWKSEDSLRPSLEDLIGAGAVISYLAGRRSPEAEAALAVFRNTAGNLMSTLERCSSGKELIDQGFREDVAIAAVLNEDAVAPRLIDGAYVAAPKGRAGREHS
jgi:2-phosphosulfolactate phosphatase